MTPTPAKPDDRYLYLSPDLIACGYVPGEHLTGLVGGHEVVLEIDSLVPVAEVSTPPAATGRGALLRRLRRPYSRLDTVLAPASGAVFELRDRRFAAQRLLAIAKVLRSGKRAFVWRPAEGVIEALDGERLARTALTSALGEVRRRVLLGGGSHGASRGPAAGTRNRYLYLDPYLIPCGYLVDPRLAGVTERHKLDLQTGTLTGADELPAQTSSGARWRRLRTPLAGLDEPLESATGAVFELTQGWLGPSHLRAIAKVLQSDRRALLWWPAEGAVEVVDRERLAGYALLTASAVGFRRVFGGIPRGSPSLGHHALRLKCDAQELLDDARPVPFVPGPSPIAGTGAYLRTDFWASMTTGGSYGHTCYVARELARSTENFVCFMGSPLDLLNDLGIRQVVLEPPAVDGTEESMMAAGQSYPLQLRTALQALGTSYIYERLCAGNIVGAGVARDLEIPYIVEYNGSEASMMRSFAGSGYAHEALFDLAERAAFAQATMISVVSEVVGDSLIERGVDAQKILVNPNGADPDVYAPLDDETRRVLRHGLGFTDDDRVVGFIGTFGGWHGVDVLAAALPQICERARDARFLLIGDGPNRALLDEAVTQHGLEGRVQMTGRVPHAEGARLLGACDVFVSPHSGGMVDSPFFGSPTKVFEYMALGQGIVASDLEQIGEVLSPALRPDDFSEGRRPNVIGERAVLCRPGRVDDFVDAVAGLVSHPAVARQLGANARRAVIETYSWERHIARLWSFLRDRGSNEATAGRTGGRTKDALQDLLETGDAYKDEVQRQWNANPCGSQYVRSAQEHTLEWFLEVERYRYDEYAPWMPETMEFSRWADRHVLEVGGGIGTDLSQFASSGAIVTDYDLSAGHLALAEENFRLRGLKGEFVHGDAGRLPFEDDRFDLVYSNGVIHHTPDTEKAIAEMLRVLRPGGKVIVMVYAEHSLHYWRGLVGKLGLYDGLLAEASIGEIMSRHVEISATGAKPLVKVYSARRLRRMFGAFDDIEIVKRQLTPGERPRALQWAPAEVLEKVMGWNLVIKAYKPAPIRPA